jgi:ABC-type phosphate/phosphonate transport system substrate-binding protein
MRWILAALLFTVTIVQAKPDADVLKIGTSITTKAEDESRGKGATETLQEYIRDETGLNPEINRLGDWRKVLEGVNKGELKVGLFQGFEFAWAREQQPQLMPLALGINVQPNPVITVVTSTKNAAQDFAGLKGQSISIPVQGQSVLRLVVEAETKKAGGKLDTFFNKVVTNQQIEDALDDVVDGVVAATAVDRIALDAFKRRKPGRFNQLKELVSSPPLPPVVVAYHPDKLDAATRAKFEKSLLEAGKKDRGKNVLSLFRLTEFVPAPADFDKLLADTRKLYPVEK